MSRDLAHLAFFFSFSFLLSVLDSFFCFCVLIALDDMREM